MRTLAIASQKGGSGKTTTAVNLAAALAEDGRRRVLVVDLDPQASASAWLAVQDEGRGLVEILEGKSSLAELARETDAPGVDLIPSGPALAGAEKALAGKVGAEVRLRRAFVRLPSERWGFVLVDCPPALGLLTVSALAAVREVLVPVEAHVLALAGVTALLDTVEGIRELLNPGLAVTGILACRVDSRTNLARDVVETLRERHGRVVFSAVIRENVRLAEAPAACKPITLYAPTSPGAEDYRSAAAELLKRAPSKRKD